MQNKTRLISSLIGATLLYASAFAADYTIDPSHSQVLFKIKHLGISTVTGRFETFEGTFSYDSAKLADSKASVTIAADSINTNSEKRDAHLKSPDFFDVATFPQLTFVAKSTEAVDATHFLVNGDLTIHGVTKPVVLDAELGGTVKDPWGMERAAFTASTKINRKDFGLTWNKALETGGFVVGDEVKIELEVEGIKQVVKK